MIYVEPKGFEDIIRMCERELPEFLVAKTVRKATKAATKIIGSGIQSEIPAATTNKHSTDRIRNAVRDKVWKIRGQPKIAGKVGYGVGQKRGTFPSHGVFFLTGTVDRWTGSKRIRVKGKTVGRKATGGKVSFRGRVKPANAVQSGFQKTRNSARTRMLFLISRDIRNFKKKQAASQQVTNG